MSKNHLDFKFMQSNLSLIREIMRFGSIQELNLNYNNLNAQSLLLLKDI